VVTGIAVLVAPSLYVALMFQPRTTAHRLSAEFPTG